MPAMYSKVKGSSEQLGNISLLEMSGDADKEIVLSAIKAVMALNREAGASNESLAAMLKVSEERRKTAFEKFCTDIMSCIYGCFGHFTKVMPQLANVRAHKEFHKARITLIPAIWQSFTCTAKIHVEPLNLQAVSRQLFDSCMKKLFAMLKTPVIQSTNEVRLLADEQNSIRYASGFVGMKLLKQFSTSKSIKAAQFRECLSHMSKNGDDSSFYAYTSQWIDSVNRGGLFCISDSTFEFFQSIEVKTRQLLPLQLAGSTILNKEKLIKLIISDDRVQLKWRPIGVDIVDDEDANELLCRIVEMWITIRGFAITSKWMEDYKCAKAKTLKKSKSLRKELNKED